MQRKARAAAKRVGQPIPERGFAIHGTWRVPFVLHGAGGVDETVHLVNGDEPARSGPWSASALGWVDTLADDAVRAWERAPYEGTNA